MKELLLDTHPGYVVLCLVIAFVYAWSMYSRRRPWDKTTNLLLSSMRFVLVFLLCFLLLGPHIRQSVQRREKPLIAIAIDNSESITLMTPKQTIQAHMSVLGNLGGDYDYRYYSFTQALATPDSVRFDSKTTDISALLEQIRTIHENDNLSAIVLYSDGIVNRGSSPLFFPGTKPIYTVAVGDSLRRKDIALKSLLANKIAYQGNEFPIVAEVLQYGFEGKTVNVILSGESGVLSRKTLVLASSVSQVEFLVAAETEGTKGYRVTIEPLSGEFSVQNNSKTTFVEILKGRQKILLLGAAPHPDIRALKAAIETNQNYELVVYLPQLEAANPKLDFGQGYDLVILHQLPALSGANSELLAQVLASKTPLWFITGSQTDYRAFNQLNLAIAFNSREYRPDKVQGVLNERFTPFSIGEQWSKTIQALPPVWVNFGGVVVRFPLQVLIWQKIGALTTEIPLLALEPSSRTAFFLGEGLWQWRLEDYRLNSNHNTFDGLVSKLSLFLANRDDKRKFRVYPASEENSDAEPVVFLSEAYNDLYEKIYGQTIELTIEGPKGFSRQFSYLHQPGVRFDAGVFQAGVYSYRAETTLNGRAEISTGKFVVNETRIEDVVTSADYAMLRELAAKTGGKSYTAATLNQLPSDLVQAGFKTKIHSSESTDYAIGLFWILLLLAFLAGLEWATRKYQGAY